MNQLHENSNYFRRSLQQLGFHAFGDKNSPVVPMMVYHPAKMASLSRALLEKGVSCDDLSKTHPVQIAVVLVGFPVTQLLLSRVRFCISSGHTREDLDYALKQVSEIGDVLCLKHGFTSNYVFE